MDLLARARERVAGLPIWSGPITADPLGGGMTNVNFVVQDSARKCVARIGEDIPVHQVMRFNEVTASRAAHAAGLSPEVIHAEPGALVIGFVEGTTLDEAAVRDDAMLARILPLIRTCHREIPHHLRGPVLMFWVFHVLRDYVGTLRDRDSAHVARLPDLLDTASELEAAVGPVEIAFGHNDLLAANFIDDGQRLWLIDWDYAGFNAPLFDLGGLASNNGLSEAQERWMLETYFETPLTDLAWRRYGAMKCASLMRETLWSMVSEVTSEIDFDYGAYTAENMTRLDAALTDFHNM